ncbi:MAG: helix-hairpin-helix domain-containing protein, partial [Candidatus Thermoplasmatota archaeon]|nr:helix-hairpin-helix domain-containing protein [Candidatus Thermoplasmatota archaeon]
KKAEALEKRLGDMEGVISGLVEKQSKNGMDEEPDSWSDFEEPNSVGDGEEDESIEPHASSIKTPLRGDSSGDVRRAPVVERPRAYASPSSPGLSRGGAGGSLPKGVSSSHMVEDHGDVESISEAESRSEADSLMLELVDALPDLISEVFELRSRLVDLEKKVDEGAMVEAVQMPEGISTEEFHSAISDLRYQIAEVRELEPKAPEVVEEKEEVSTGRTVEKDVKKLEERMLDLMDEVGFGESLDVSKIPPNILEIVYQSTLNDVFTEMRKTLGVYDAEGAVSRILEDVRLQTSGSELFYYDGRMIRTRDISGAIEKKMVSAKQMHTTYSAILDMLLQTVPGHKAKNFRAMIKIKSQEFAIDTATKHNYKLKDIVDKIDNMSRVSASLSATLNTKYQELKEQMEAQEQNFAALLREQHEKTDALFQSVPESYVAKVEMENMHKTMDALAKKVKSLSSDVSKVIASMGIDNLPELVEDVKDDFCSEKFVEDVKEDSVDVLEVGPETEELVEGGEGVLPLPSEDAKNKEEETACISRKLMPNAPGTMVIGDDEEEMVAFLTKVKKHKDQQKEDGLEEDAAGEGSVEDDTVGVDVVGKDVVEEGVFGDECVGVDVVGDGVVGDDEETGAEEMKEEPEASEVRGADFVQTLADVPGLGKKIVDILVEEGYGTRGSMASLSIDELTGIKGIGKATAKKIMEAIDLKGESESVLEPEKSVEVQEEMAVEETPDVAEVSEGAGKPGDVEEPEVAGQPEDGEGQESKNKASAKKSKKGKGNKKARDSKADKESPVEPEMEKTPESAASMVVEKLEKTTEADAFQTNVSEEDKLALLSLLDEEKTLAKLKKEAPLKYTVLLDAIKVLLDEDRITIET